MIQDPGAQATLQAFVLLARHHGMDTSVDELERQYVLGEGGVSDAVLVALAADLGLDARWVTLNWSQLPKLSKILPAMLRLRDGGALILESVTKDESSGLVALVGDPLAGSEVRAAIDETQLTALWGGQVLMVKIDSKGALNDEPFSFNWILKQVLKERSLFRDIGISAFISSLFAIVPPFTMKIIIDRVLVDKSQMTWILLAVIFVAMVIFEMLLTFLRGRFMELAATRIDGRLQIYVMERLLRLPMSYFETTPVGRTASKVNKIEVIREFLTGELLNTSVDSIMLLVLVPILFVLSWALAFWVVALGLCIFMIIMIFLRPLMRLNIKFVESEIRKHIYLIESLYGMRTIKSLALEGRRRMGWDVVVAENVGTKHDWGVLANYPTTLVVPFERLMYTGSLMLGTAAVLWSTTTSGATVISAGSMVAFVLIASRTAAPLVKVAGLLDSYHEIKSAVYQVASVMNEPPEITRGQSGLRQPIKGDIVFDNVQFRYVAGAPLALSGASFAIRPGTIFGIMGRSGSGKTTITRLLQGLNTDFEGMVKIDGMDLREIDLHHLRTSIGVVPQENFLFSGSVRDNIGMAKAGATFPQIVRAAQLAGAEEFIEKMPRGYDTRLEEGASNLSGGQRQRLALARALLIEPSVLILDEATSALDAESEAIINANLVRIAEGRTIICVSHRLSMLVPADAILVLEQGKTYDVGRHEELLHRCDIYKHMWHTQNRHLDAPSHARPVLARSSTN
ncbi:MAG TPA: peptidase domain-containing ABC transporter [Caulobacteraceae bacterium]